MVSRKRKSGVKDARESAYRTLVLDAAERVFAAQGFEGAKIKDVADEAGLALGTVYTVFASKHDVFIAVHERRGGALLAELLEAIASREAPVEALFHGLHVACRFYALHPNYLRMHLFSGTSWAAPRLLLEEERRVYDAGRAPVVALLARAAARGELGAESPDTAAGLLLASLQVYFAEWAHENLATPPDAVAERIVGHVQRALLRDDAAKPS